MKKIILGAVAGLLSVAGLSSAAHAEMYGKVGGGATFGGTYSVDGVGDADQDDMGWGVNGALGTNITPNIRAEGELGYSSSELDGGLDATTTTGMANVYYDFAPGAGINPFIGAGIGAGKYEVEDEDDTALTYQATAGVSTQLSDHVTGELAYRYTAAPELDVGGLDADFSGSAVTAGVRFKLGG